MPFQQVLTDPLTLEAIAKVSYETLTPIQQPTSIKLLKSIDVYQQRFVKYPHCVICHSYAEFLFCLLLESSRDISNFVPHPFTFRIGRKKYTPNCFFYEQGNPKVIELKEELGTDPELERVITNFLAWHGMLFSVISNETIYEKRHEALHWLPIVQTLVSANTYRIDTSALEIELFQECLSLEEPTVGDLIDAGSRASQANREIALLRLIHQHQLDVDLRTKPLDFNSVLRTCKLPGKND